MLQMRHLMECGKGQRCLGCLCSGCNTAAGTPTLRCGAFTKIAQGNAVIALQLERVCGPNSVEHLAEQRIDVRLHLIAITKVAVTVNLIPGQS